VVDLLYRLLSDSTAAETIASDVTRIPSVSTVASHAATSKHTVGFMVAQTLLRMGALDIVQLSRHTARDGRRVAQSIARAYVRTADQCQTPDLRAARPNAHCERRCHCPAHSDAECTAVRAAAASAVRSAPPMRCAATALLHAN
jgi:hypothetical protein